MAATAQRRGRRALTATAAAAAVTATGVLSVQPAAAEEPAPEAAQTCVMETLPIPEGLIATQVSGMSDDGSVIAYYALPLDQTWPDGLGAYPRLYTDGQVTEVPMPGDHPRLHDVNSEGTATGYTNIDGDDIPYVWRDGALSQLPSPNGGQAHGINEHGDIVGALGSYLQQPVVWPADGSGPVDLPLPANAEWGMATGIGDDGTIVGYHSDGETGSKPYVWRPDGTAADLPMPEGVALADAHSVPLDLNGDWASGIIFAPGLENSGIRWNLAADTAEMTDLNYSVAVSAGGTVAGYLPGLPTAAFQTEDAIVELPGAVDAAYNPSRDEAVEISGDGTLIAGDVFVGIDEAGLYYWNAVTWTCSR
ncbi:hypothetical protein L0U85_08795 [Glycomyces sp. L485]|uniref:hypothetical protein n=1 Tax=Glycomyces sp. L485 TaxID=2909235 RepID=UPI001F4B6E4C|nr:hypothetical protein [Glycomyces sp. L485]MCH7230945.1 hypothetical protein [Glycomyces sp. L485]